MACCKKNDMAVLLVVVTVVMATSAVVEGQDVPACAAKLVPCGPYLNSTNPPEECCKPLREAVEKERDCLCKLFNDPSFFESIGINITQALELPKHCNITADITACKKASAPSPIALPLPPPGAPGGEKGGVSRNGWTGMSSVVLCWVSIVVYLGTSSVL